MAQFVSSSPASGSALAVRSLLGILSLSAPPMLTLRLSQRNNHQKNTVGLEDAHCTILHMLQTISSCLCHYSFSYGISFSFPYSCCLWHFCASHCWCPPGSLCQPGPEEKSTRSICERFFSVINGNTGGGNTDSLLDMGKCVNDIWNSYIHLATITEEVANILRMAEHKNEKHLGPP